MNLAYLACYVIFQGVSCILKNVFLTGGSEGTNFVFSFPRTYNEYTTEIRITSRVENRVSLSIDGFMYVYEIPARGSVTHKGDSSTRVTSGLENKGFELTSDYPVTATLGSSSHDSTHSPDDRLLRPLTSDDTEFFIISFLGSAVSDADFPLSFFTVTAADDDTSVSIFDSDGQSYSDQVLDR